MKDLTERRQIADELYAKLPQNFRDLLFEQALDDKKSPIKRDDSWAYRRFSSWMANPRAPISAIVNNINLDETTQSNFLYIIITKMNRMKIPPGAMPPVYVAAGAAGGSGASGGSGAPVPTNPRSDAFRTLELPDSATHEEIKQAYHRLVLVHHPDKGGSEEVFKKIANAYQLLIGRGGSRKRRRRQRNKTRRSRR